ncbi:hypothetical protein [Lancefieldella parvula]|uniref:hypothetical protein n=1 Tax=Lancefieldella parvula TaxID=1382 RepID=UPI00288A6989|nr:hypothetical protein [Lancefieldella parvula]
MLTKQQIEDTFKELEEANEAESQACKRAISSLDECLASLDRLINALKGDIVRCRDCIYYDTVHLDCARQGWSDCERDGFCAWGERKENA